MRCIAGTDKALAPYRNSGVRVLVGQERERDPAPTPLDGTCPSYPPRLSSYVLTIPVAEFALG